MASDMAGQGAGGANARDSALAPRATPAAAVAASMIPFLGSVIAALALGRLCTAQLYCLSLCRAQGRECGGQTQPMESRSTCLSRKV